MQTITNQTLTTSYAEVASRPSLWTRFINYGKNREHNRLLWLGTVLEAHGCILTPITIALALAAGPNFFLFMTAMVAMAITLVTNLAAMPTKITIPVFVLSIVVDIAIVISCCNAFILNRPLLPPLCLQAKKLPA